MGNGQFKQRNGFFPPSGKFILYLFVAICGFFASCQRYYYAPASVNIPLLSEKEAKINAQYAVGFVSKAFETQSAFAINRHFGAMLNTSLGNSIDEETDFETGSTHTGYIDVGAGYFTPIKSTSLVFETYSGIGTGGARNKYGTGDSKVRFTKLFIQPNIGLKMKGFEFGLSSRMSWVKHNVISYTVPPEDDHFQDVDFISNNPITYEWEPGFVLRAGGKKFMVQMQYTCFINLTHDESIFDEEEAYLTLGFSLPIHYKTAGQ